MLLSTAASDFVRYCTFERQLSQHTIQAYTADLADLQRWLPSQTSVEEVTQDMLRAYLAELVGLRKLAVATVRRRFACLRSFFRRLAKEVNAADPFAGWQLQLARRRRLPRALSRAEVSSLLGSSKSNDLCALISTNKILSTAMLLMVSTGMRVGELCKLTIDDIAPDASALRIQGKGSRDRIAYITDPALRTQLQRLVRSRRESAQQSRSLFVNRNGAPMKPQSIRSRLRRHAADSGLSRRVTPHMLRHTAATLLIETGVDIRFVQRLLGHSSIATTEIYTHVSDEALRATLERANVLGAFV